MSKKYFRQPWNTIGAALIAVLMCFASTQTAKAARNLKYSTKNLTVSQRVLKVRQHISLANKTSKTNPDAAVEPSPPWNNWNNNWNDWNNWKNYVLPPSPSKPEPSPSPSGD